MGKAATDLDLLASQVRQSYLYAASNNNWISAAHFAYVLNQTRSAKRRITNLLPYKPKGIGLRQELIMEKEAQDWCMRFFPLIEAAMTRERDILMSNYR